MGFPGAAHIISKLYNTEFVYGAGFKKHLTQKQIEVAHNLMRYCYENKIDALSFISECEKNNKNALIESGVLVV